VNSHPDLVEAARTAIDEVLRSERPRLLIGIAGAPAAGKSTLAKSLTRALNREFGAGYAVTVPMDGFHLANSQLARLGLSARKGAPETFDAAGFVNLLRRLHDREELVYAPEYSRILHESIGSAIPVPASVRVILVEGNYLLIPGGQWAAVRPLLDLALYIETLDKIRVKSLLRRQQNRGLSLEAARTWVFGSDEVNTALIGTTRQYADVILIRL
jgi:pantothenate kinase